MAVEITVAYFRTTLAACGDAVEAADWATAKQQWAVAEIVNAGLDLVSEFNNHKIERRQSLDGVKAAIDQVETAVASAADTRRILNLNMRTAR